MGTLVWTIGPSTMRPTLFLFALTFAIAAEVCQAYSIDRQPFQVEKRGYRDPDDPRNLFAAMYGGNYKRSDPTNSFLENYDHHLGALPLKRGLRIGTTPGTCSARCTARSSVAEPSI